MSIAMQIRHTVELNAPLMLRVIPGVLMENDTEANAVVLEITQDGKPCQIDGQTVSATLLREDGNAVLLEGEENGSIATVKLTPACYRVPGSFVMSVRLSNVEGESRTIWRATGRMEAENVGSIVDDEHIVPTLDELLAQMEAMESAREEAMTAAGAASEAAQKAQEAVADVDEKVEAAQSAASSATTAANNATAAASNALIAADNASADAAETRETAAQLSRDVETINNELITKIDGAYVENGYLYMTSNGEVLVGPLGPFSGTGGGTGGGSGNAAVITVTNTTGWLSKTVAAGKAVPLTFTWSSVEDELQTGPGVLSVRVGGVTKLSRDVDQGDVSVDVGPYLAAGSNAVKVTISDTYGNSRTINFSITAVAISLASSFDPTGPFTGAITYTYVPTGGVTKTVHFVVDGTEIGTATVDVSGRQQSYIIPAQSHGAHSLLVYFTAEIDGQTVESNELYYELICTVEGETGTIIATTYRARTAQQFETVVIPYRVFDPAALTAPVTLSANGQEVSAITVDRTEQTWTYIPDTTGALELTIESGSAKRTISLTVTESKIDVEAESEALALYLTSYGRSNGEANPGQWVSGDIEASLTGFNYKSDGWQKDAAGNTVLRVTGDARVEVPYNIFGSDFRSSGKTIEVEFATRDVLDYDAMILSSVSEGRGIDITAQRADLMSEQSEIGTQYKEDEHVRLTFVVEKRSGNRLILIYLNGIISGIRQYPAADDFAQGTPVGISIGSNESTIDLYNIRVYDNDLTRYQLLDNWIADTQNGADKLARFERNQIYDDYGAVVPEKLPKSLPYMMLVGPALPTIKGNKVTISGYYVDPLHPEKSFTFTDAEADVQGTSSKDYYVKNFKIKFKNGFTVNGTPADGYKLRDNSIPTDVFTMKADVASSEGANNVELVRLYNDITPHKTPPQEGDARVRQGIDGLPCVIFWDNGSAVTFQGKYNFNNDKATEEVFGFAEGDESWEIRNNVSDRVMFKSADFSDSSSETGWPNDFEARYPEDNTDVSRLAAFVAWVVSTDRDKATGAALNPPVAYEGTVYNADTEEYRLAKFRNELSQHANVVSAQFYWLFTEFFLMVDSRAKNAFPTRYSGDGQWCWLPYDMDTAIGINNEGALVFDYALEDTDYTEAGEQVFNGQQSVFWKNVRDAFADEIRAMYADLRTSEKLTYENVMERFDAHQDVWPEAIFNEDAFRKYIEPYEQEGATIYFAMAQGKKELQRTWWLYNRFRYMDAKYDTGTIAKDRILIRIYAEADIPVVPYADTYLRSKYGSYSYQIRAKRDQEYLLHCYVDSANDLETTIFPASLIAEIADLSALKIGLADFSKAVKLQVLKIGDGAEGYQNGNLTELTLGNNTLLHHLDVRNCPNLKMAVDLSGCNNIETVLFDGTSITGLSLPNGGILKTLHLPGTVTNLTILNQRAITDFVLPSYSQITTLRLENVSDAVPVREIFAAIPASSRVRLIGIDWAMESAVDILTLYDRLDTMRGLDENDGNMDKAQVSGVLRVPTLTGAELAEMKSRYPYIEIAYESISSYLYFYDETGTNLLAMATVEDGGDGVYQGTTPTKAQTAQYTYTFAGWSLTPGGSANPDALKGVTADRSVYAAFTATVRTYTVRWYNGSTLLETDTGVPYGTTPTYNGADPVYNGTGNAEDYEWSGWTPAVGPVKGNVDYKAAFRYTGYLYPAIIDGTVTEYSSDTLTEVGQYAFYGSAYLEKAELAAVTAIGESAFEGCSAMTMLILRSATMATLGSNALASSAIAGGTGYVYVPAALVDTYKANSAWSAYTAQIRAIEDYPETWAKLSWEMVNYRIEQGDYASYYAVGDLIPLDLGTEGLVNMQIAGFDVDDLADGSGKAHISFISKELLETTHRMNPVLVTNDDGTYQEGTGGIGGWEKSEMRAYLYETIKPLIPEKVRKRIVPITKTQRTYDTTGTLQSQTTEDDVWLPNDAEVEGESSLYYALFKDTNANRIKYKVGSSSSSSWWLRDVYGTSTFRYATKNGRVNYYNASESTGIALGFCM